MITSLRRQFVLILFVLSILYSPFCITNLHAGTVQLPASGQTKCYNTQATGSVTFPEISCAGTGQDGAIKAGVAWPDPRFTNNGNGTITDNLTGLIWLRNANCEDTVGGITKTGGFLTWADSLTWSNNLAAGKCGLSDGSQVGQWRLPSIKELKSLIDRSKDYPAALPAGHPFTNIQTNQYWSSSTYVHSIDRAWAVHMVNGKVTYKYKDGSNYVWPVRGGQ
jgi:hypothetical protein